MIATNAALLQVQGELQEEIEALEGELQVVMSAAETADRHAKEAAAMVTESSLGVSEIAQSLAHALSRLDVVVPALGEALTKISRLEMAVQRIDNNFAMLLDYLDAEIVYVPERITTEDGAVVDIQEAEQYIDKKPKSRR